MTNTRLFPKEILEIIGQANAARRRHHPAPRAPSPRTSRPPPSRRQPTRRRMSRRTPPLRGQGRRRRRRRGRRRRVNVTSSLTRATTWSGWVLTGRTVGEAGVTGLSVSGGARVDAPAKWGGETRAACCTRGCGSHATHVGVVLVQAACHNLKWTHTSDRRADRRRAEHHFVKILSPESN